MERKYSKLVDTASSRIPGFSERMEQLKKWMLIHGQTRNTLVNYSRKIAELALSVNKLPEDFNDEELRNHLADRVQNARSRSLSEFKHTIYGLRCYFKMLGKEKEIKLPRIKTESRLPVVLSKEECRLLFTRTKNFKHRLLLLFVYSGGLRVSEVINLKWSDVDIDRMMVHIKRSKGDKDRYVPLAAYLLEDLSKYMLSSCRSAYVFPGSNSATPFGRSGARWLMRRAVKRAGINKERVCLHTLRHSFATHLLEDGMDIVSIKELLGHTRVEHTLVYLHVSDYSKPNKFSPLDKLFGESNKSELPELKKRFAELSIKKTAFKKENNKQLDLFSLQMNNKA